MSTGSEKQPAQERIVEAAMRLFSEKGLCGTSMREITEEAGVNLASVNYHFGSKEGLIAEVFLRYLAPINRARLARLDVLEAASSSRPPGLEPLLEAFIQPAVVHALGPGKVNYPLLRLVGRCLSEPLTYAEKHIYPHFLQVAQRFRNAIGRELPDVPPEEIHWRLSLVNGALHYALHAWGTDSTTLQPGMAPDAGVIVDRLVAFGAAGLRLSKPEAAGNGRNIVAVGEKTVHGRN
ncbi:MAG: TetR/AcrR family transcriptional regulator [Desulfobacteraceae bacterium]|nr:TetR/AcrR family transcriptional regulator [Desulfobacteraceae bacterium]